MKKILSLFGILFWSVFLIGPEILYTGSNLAYAAKPYTVGGLNGTVDPTSTATNAPLNTYYFKTSSPQGIFKKNDNGTSTNWTQVASLGGGSTPTGSHSAVAYYDASTGNLTSPSQTNPNSLTWINSTNNFGIRNNAPLSILQLFATPGGFSGSIDPTCVIVGTIAAGATCGTNGYIEGTINTAGAQSHSEGDHNLDAGTFDHIEGGNNSISFSVVAPQYNHVEGQFHLVTDTTYGHVEGYGNTLNKSFSGTNINHIEGSANLITAGANNHVEGTGNTSQSSQSHVEGSTNFANFGSSNVHIGGINNQAFGINSFVFGNKLLDYAGSPRTSNTEIVFGDNNPHAGVQMSSSQPNAFWGRFAGGYQFEEGSASPVSSIFNVGSDEAVRFAIPITTTTGTGVVAYTYTPTVCGNITGPGLACTDATGGFLTKGVFYVKAKVTYSNSTGSVSGAFEIAARAKLIANVMTVGVNTIIFTSTDDVLAGATLTGSGSSVILTVAGSTGNTYYWTSVVTVNENIL